MGNLDNSPDQSNPPYYHPAARYDRDFVNPFLFVTYNANVRSRCHDLQDYYLTRHSVCCNLRRIEATNCHGRPTYQQVIHIGNCVDIEHVRVRRAFAPDPRCQGLGGNGPCGARKADSRSAGHAVHWPVAAPGGQAPLARKPQLIPTAIESFAPYARIWVAAASSEEGPNRDVSRLGGAPQRETRRWGPRAQSPLAAATQILTSNTKVSVIIGITPSPAKWR